RISVCIILQGDSNITQLRLYMVVCCSGMETRPRLFCEVGVQEACADSPVHFRAVGLYDQITLWRTAYHCAYHMEGPPAVPDGSVRSNVIINVYSDLRKLPLKSLGRYSETGFLEACRLVKLQLMIIKY